MAASIHEVTACCAMPSWFYGTLRCSIGDRQAMVVTANPGPYDTTHKPFTDTLYFPEFSACLKAAYNYYDLVFIAKVTRAVPFMPKIDSLDQVVFQSESVTVSLETVIKGNSQPLTWNFISQDHTVSERWIKDSLTGEISICRMEMSLNETHFASIRNERYLFFLNEKYFTIGDDGTFARILPGSCDQFSYSYKINKNNEIYFDGFVYDTLAKSISNIPEVTCPLNEFTHEVLYPTSIGGLHVINKIDAVNTPVAIYNLLGKRLSPVGRQAQVRNSPGVYIFTGTGQNKKNGSGFLHNSIR